MFVGSAANQQLAVVARYLMVQHTWTSYPLKVIGVDLDIVVPKSRLTWIWLDVDLGKSGTRNSWIKKDVDQDKNGLNMDQSKWRAS